MTTPQPIDPASIKPAKFWYWVAGAVFGLSLVPAFFLAKSGADTIDLSVDIIGDDTIEIEDEPLSLFAPVGVTPGLVECTLTPPNGGQSILLETASSDLSLDGRRRIAVTPDDLPAGSYRLVCAAGSDQVDVTRFGVQSTEGWTAAILKIIAAVVIPVFVGLAAITIVIVTAVRRSAARRRLLRPPGPPAGPPGYPPPGPPPPGYPPPSV